MDYRELAFYQKAVEVVKKVNVAIKRWPNTMQSQTISHQLFRATTSIGANIAEGHGRHSGPEYVHFLTIAQGSANEVDHWLNTALDCQLGDAAEIQNLIRLNNETRKMLTASINSLRAKQNHSIHEPPIPYSPIPSNIIQDNTEENPGDIL